ncbi:MAG: hypothetical protein PARBA_03099 [Parabacteroides sp.]
MYKGFELFVPIEFWEEAYFKRLLSDGRKRYNLRKKEVETKINSFISKDGCLDGSKMQEDWFPQVFADVFISHSHDDEDLAICLSQWLYERFGLETFVDSCIWGYANNLLKEIDNEYCRPDKDNNPNSYSYENRNYSTSHVHMMLSTALSMMIDKVECLFFLNTPNSIQPKDSISRTHSPWIYYEIAATKYIQKKERSDYRLHGGVELFSEGGSILLEKAERGVPIDYEIDTEHLTDIYRGALAKWEKMWPYGKPYNAELVHSLDILYAITLK